MGSAHNNLYFMTIGVTDFDPPSIKMRKKRPGNRKYQKADI